MNLKKIVRQKLSKYKNQRIVLGVSGGPDSMALFYLLLSLRSDLVVAHFNYCWREIESDRDANFVRNTAQKLQAPYEVGQKDLLVFAQKNKMNLEAAARLLRYDFFQKIKKKYQAKLILVAHTYDDHLETIFLHLLRGSFMTTGLSEISDQGIWRPLLQVRKEEILKFLASNKIKFKKDQTNQDRNFTRNFVRHDLFPFLRKRVPNFEKKLLKYAETNRRKLKVINQKAIDFLGNKNDFLIKKFLLLACDAQGAVIKKIWENLHGSSQGLENARVVEISNLAETNQGGKRVRFGRFWAEAHKGRIIFL